MCAPSPKTAKTPVEKIPDRQPLLLPDGGDPSVRAGMSSGIGQAAHQRDDLRQRSAVARRTVGRAPLGTRAM
jgi:hypothetical protein